MDGETKNPPTLIHSPLANAVKASAMTKFGNREDIKTTSDSPARRSRKSHMTQVKKAAPVGRKLVKKYAISEKISEMRNKYGKPIKKFAIIKALGPYRPFARSLMKVARSSKKAGTYATAMKDMNADPKKIAFVNGCIEDWTGGRRSQTVPIMIARPIYMAKRIP